MTTRRPRFLRMLTTAALTLTLITEYLESGMIRIIQSGLATLILSLVSISIAQADIVSLTLSADVENGTWEAFLAIDDPQNQTLGLAGIEFDVIGSGGLSVDSSVVQLPLATESQDFMTFFQKGFFNFRSDGTNGVDIRAAQDLFMTLSSTGSGNSSILEGVGKAAFSEDNGLIPSTEVGLPVRIASGTFIGTTGTLQLVGDSSSTTLLPAVLPSFGNPISTFSPSAVIGDTLSITAVPEPASVALIGGIVAMLTVSRRRRTV